jgi:transposase
MSSTVEERLALIGRAIDEVDAAASAGQLSGAEVAELTARLAHIWAMIAELDPALARRLRGYADSE